MKSVLEAGGDPGPLPQAWKIQSPKSTILLGPVGTGRKADRILHLEELARQLRGYSYPSEFPDAHAALSRILARSEFAGDAPPSQWEVLRQQIVEWIQDLLRRIFDFASQRPTTSKVLFWTILSLALSGIILFLARLWMRTGEKEVSSMKSLPVRISRSTSDWVRAAKLAAEKGDLAAAIQAAYWAGITRLEETSVLPANRACTPREYLRLTAPEQLGPLKILTRALERFWYGRQQAALQDFQTSLQQLEALGCKLD